MNKALYVIKNAILLAVVLLGSSVIWVVLPLTGELWRDVLNLVFIVATISLLIWGRGLVGRLVRLPWHLFKLIHQHWWSALVFWVGATFIGLLPPFALIGWVVSVILASPRQPEHVMDDRSYSDDYLDPIHDIGSNFSFHDTGSVDDFNYNLDHGFYNTGPAVSSTIEPS